MKVGWEGAEISGGGAHILRYSLILLVLGFALGLTFASFF